MDTALFCFISVAFTGKICEFICIRRSNHGISEAKGMVLMVFMVSMIGSLSVGTFPLLCSLFS